MTIWGIRSMIIPIGQWQEDFNKELLDIVWEGGNRMFRALPSISNRANNVCAFCNYWEGDAKLQSHGATMVELDERTKGRCLKTGFNQTAIHYACSRFEISNEASRYAKR